MKFYVFLLIIFESSSPIFDIVIISAHVQEVFLEKLHIITLSERGLRDEIDNFEGKKKSLNHHQNFCLRLCF